MFKIKRISANKKMHLSWPGLFMLLMVGSILLSSCGYYEGYPTAAPVTATPDSNATPPPTATALPQPTYPPLPTATPRPTLPPTPANVSVKKGDVMQQVYSALFNNYYEPLSSADIYEVGLIGIRDALKAAGVSQPDVPIPAFTNNPQQDWQIFLQAFTITLGRYSSKLAEDKLAYAALQHSTELLNDCNTPQTAFYPPDQAESYLRARTGSTQYTGLGINVLPFDNTSGHFITRLVSGTPAEQSGLKLGDAIVAVNGQDVTRLDSTQLVQVLQGNNAPAGSKVNLTVRRAGTNRQETVEVARALIRTPIYEPKILPDNIGYIRFNTFPVTATDAILKQFTDEFDRIITDFNNKGVKGFVLDVRATRYGNIRLIQNLLSRFVSGQDLIYLATRNQQGQRDAIAMPSINNVKPTDKPVAVLIDQATSHEAELFALAIQNKKKGSVFGTPTEGCAIATIPFSLSDSSVLSLSVVRGISDTNDPTSWLDSVQPDVVVALDAKTLGQGQDAQLDMAVAFIKK